MKKILMLAVTLVGITSLAHAQSKKETLINTSLTTSCSPSCPAGTTFTISGSGLKAQGNLVVVVIGSPVRVTCDTPINGSFTCATEVPLAGTFNAIAYSVSSNGMFSTIGSTMVTID